MITRKNRKQSLKVREMKEIEEQLESDGERDRKRLVRIFLETWLEAKQQLIHNGGDFEQPDDTIHDVISSKLVAKGYNISSKLALNKTAGFYKKYQFVRKCEQDGKKIEWANYDIVKKIFEINDKEPPTVKIPIDNIKNEGELAIVDDMDDDGDRATAAVKNCVDVTERAPTTQTQTTNQTNNVEIKTEEADDVKNNETNSTHDDDDSKVSDLDDELDFDNPLDNITLRLPGSNSAIKPIRASPISSSMPPPAKKNKRDSTDTQQPQQIPMPSLTPKEFKIVKIPNASSSPKPPLVVPKVEGVKPAPNPVPLTVPGLKPGEFLIPIGSPKPGQAQQFLVVKRLPGGAVANNAGGVSSSVGVSGGIKISSANSIGRSSPIGTVNSTTQQNKVVPTHISPAHSPFVISSTPPPPPPPLNINPKTMPTLQSHPSPSEQNFTLVLTKLVDIYSASKSMEKERLELERKRFESDQEHQKELISIIKDIRDKLCDKKD